MVWFLGDLTGAAVLVLVCPHCRKKQVRARKAKGARYRCRKCRRLFSRETGLAAAAGSGR